MRLIDLDQPIFVPITDESQGGVKYEVQMTMAEFFDKFFEGYQPEIVEAVPVVRCRDCVYYNTTGCGAGFGWCEDAVVNTGVWDDFYCADGKRRDDYATDRR